MYTYTYIYTHVYNVYFCVNRRQSFEYIPPENVSTVRHIQTQTISTFVNPKSCLHNMHPYEINRRDASAVEAKMKINVILVLI